VITHATGPFDVKMTPQPATDGFGDPAIGRMALDKTFHGDLAATSKGEMLAVRTSIAGSAGYVAMERVVGTLHGRGGSFALQHSGSMSRGAPSLAIHVVPDSGTDALVGLTGTLTITNVDGKHAYDFAYDLPAS
jgi:hypothetical protein